MMKKLFLLLFLPLNLIGCANLNGNLQDSFREKYIYEPIQDVKIVVAPFNDSMNQINYANKVEFYLVEFGFSVVDRPLAVASISERSGKQQQEGNRNQDSIINVGNQNDIVKSYIEYEKTDADYIFQCSASYNESNIRIVNRKTKAVVGIGDVSMHSRGSDDLRELLVKSKLLKVTKSTL